MVQDARGDVEQDVIDKERPGKPSAALDIVGGDIGADAHTITTVIRLAGPTRADSYSPLGFAYSFRFTVNNTGDTPQSFSMEADVGPMSQLFSMFRYTSGASAGVGVYIRGAIDNVRHELRMTADIGQLQELAQGALTHPVGHRLYDFVAVSGTSNGDPQHGTVSKNGADVAAGGKSSIKIGAASCVRPVN